MSAWFKTKPKLTSQASLHPDIVRSIHTMQDDLDGRTPTAVSPSDPLVAFQPGQSAEGVAFYAAPELQEPVSTAAPAGGTTPAVPSSPFLIEGVTPPQPPLAPAQPEAPQVALSQPVAAPSVPPSALPVIDMVAPVSPSTNVPLPPQALPQAPADTLPQPVPVDTETPINPTAPKAMLMNLFRTYRWWLIGVGGAVTITAMLWFGWQWYRDNASNKPIVAEGTIQLLEPTPTPEQAPAPAPKEPHYSVEQPNLLSFDTETVSAQAMMTELLQIGMAIQKDNLQQPVEFSIRDQKFNPLAFARFAYLLNLSLSPEVLVALDEEFSLFYVLDQGRPRLGFSVKIKDIPGFNQALTAGESELPRALEAIFLDVTTAPKSGIPFRAGLYRDQPLRFANVDSALNLSIDYAVRGDRWILGTSQLTLRSILDTSDPEAAPADQNPSSVRLP